MRAWTHPWMYGQLYNVYCACVMFGGEGRHLQAQHIRRPVQQLGQQQCAAGRPLQAAPRDVPVQLPGKVLRLRVEQRVLRWGQDGVSTGCERGGGAGGEGQGASRWPVAEQPT